MAVHEALNQRVVVRHHLAGLTRDELALYLQHLLRLAGTELPLFDASAIDALSAAEGPDLVLLDLRLPDCDDLHVLAVIHQLAPRVPIILMTAYASRDVLDDALRVGASVVIGKPFDMEKIGPLVERALAARPS